MKARLRLVMMGLLAVSLLAGIAVNADEGSHVTYGPEKGWLMAEGGGGPYSPGMLQHFLSLAGGPQANIVYITTASPQPISKEEAEATFLGDKNITQLNTHDRAVADSETYVAALRKATGVWIEGGDETPLVKTYVGTRTQEEMKALLARGGVVGGGSAGAIVLGAVSLQPVAHGSGFSECVKNLDRELELRAKNIQIRPCQDFGAFGFVHNVFILPHVLQRGGENNMALGMAIFPGLLGIGVDVGAAVVIHGNQCEVIGDSKVFLPDGSKDKGYEVLSAGARFDLVQAMKRMEVLVDNKTKTETIDALRKDLRESYVYPEMGDKLATMLEGHRAHGDYNSVANAGEFLKLLNQQISDMAHDPNLYVFYRAQAGGPVAVELEPPPSPGGGGRLPKPSDFGFDYGFTEAKSFPGEIGFLPMHEFPREMDHAGPLAAGAMAFLANTNTLIIDLRESEGGAPWMVEFLASYFFDHPVHLNDIDFRKPGTSDYKVEQRWTLPNVPGQRYLNKKVYILTSHRTASVAEEFAYDMQALKRATVVGEATWGSANPGDDRSLGEHFTVFLPTGHSVNPITHTNWETVGVKPDIQVPAADALFTVMKTVGETPGNLGGPGAKPQALHLSADIDNKTKTETIDALRKDLRQSYVYPEMGGKLATMLEEHQAHGDYNSVANAGEFLKLLNQQMSDMAHDPNLYVFYRAQAGGLAELEPPPSPGGGGRLPESGDDGFKEVKFFSGKNGYLQMLEFPRDMDRAGPVAAGAMAFLANTNALIIDLRESEGGAPWMVEFLASYFFDHPVHLNDIDFRKPGTSDYKVEQRWTLPNVPGQRYLNKKVYILTSHRTASVAEEFAYDMQALKRATVVGEATWGSANPGDDRSLGEHFTVFLPTGHSVNPITHTNWETVGVKPDIQVPAADALLAALNPGQPEALAFHLSADILQTFTGKYQVTSPEGAPARTVEITANPDGLVLVIGGQSHPFGPLPSNGEFSSQELPDVNILFNKDSSGEVTGFTVTNYPSLQKATKLP